MLGTIEQSDDFKEASFWTLCIFLLFKNVVKSKRQVLKVGRERSLCLPHGDHLI